MPKGTFFSRGEISKSCKMCKKELEKRCEGVIYSVRKQKERGLIQEMMLILNDVDDLIFRDEEWICSDR